MVVIVTQNVPHRFRGFLASCMFEIAPGVYTAPNMTQGVMERVWSVLEEWWGALEPEGSVVMTWCDEHAPGGQGLRYLGIPPHEFLDYDGMILVRRPLSQADRERQMWIDRTRERNESSKVERSSG